MARDYLVWLSNFEKKVMDGLSVYHCIFSGLFIVFFLSWKLVFRDGCGTPSFYFGNRNRMAELHQGWLSGMKILIASFIYLIHN